MVPYSAIIPHERILLKLFIVVSTDNVLIDLRSRSRLQVLAKHQHEYNYIEESDNILLERRWWRCGSGRRMDEGTERVDARIGVGDLKARVGHDGEGEGVGEDGGCRERKAMGIGGLCSMVMPWPLKDHACRRKEISQVRIHELKKYRQNRGSRGVGAMDRRMLAMSEYRRLLLA